MGILYFCGFGGLAAVIALYYFQGYLLYYPNMPTGSRTDLIDPKRYFTTYSMRYYEEITLKTIDNVRVKGWLFKQPNSTEVPTMLFLHSNAGNLSHRLSNIRSLYYDLKINVFILSYRGYGQSEGHPTEAGLQNDARAALDFLSANPDIDPARIILFGRSLGGAVAIYLAATHEHPVCSLIVENTFTSVPDMIDTAMPFLKWFKFLCTNIWDSSKIISQIKTPMLFLSGAQDPLVPPTQMTKLYNLSNSKIKKLVVFPDATHMDCVNDPKYYHEIDTFLVKVLGSW